MLSFRSHLAFSILGIDGKNKLNDFRSQSKPTLQIATRIITFNPHPVFVKSIFRIKKRVPDFHILPTKCQSSYET